MDLFDINGICGKDIPGDHPRLAVEVGDDGEFLLSPEEAAALASALGNWAITHGAEISAEADENDAASSEVAS